MNETELRTAITEESERCNREIWKIEKEIARLSGKKEELEDRKVMLFGFLQQI